MGLSDGKVEAVVAVSDIAKAKEFYEGKLGLSGAKDEEDGGITYTCGGGTMIHLYPSPDNAGKSPATLAAFLPDDVEGTVDELAGKGVEFEQYGEPLNTNEKGIAKLGDSSGAWFKDPDGNILAIGEQP
jgi:catechol 2,3-dioxygenase-like lactoylglutathione lyase family enzyme